jgi:glycosyltransferase involved in cell wall biosynthesis
MRNTPLVSILAVSYNHEDWVIEALDSIRHQTYSNIQLVIIDDCSTDNTVTLIEAWLKKHQIDCVFITHKSNKGICKTYNEGVSLCEGKYYSTLSCDDTLAHEKTEKQVTYFEQQGEEVGMIYSDATILSSETGAITKSFIKKHRKDNLKPTGNIFNELIQQNFVPAMSILVRKKAFDHLKGFDEDLIFEDYDFFLRMAKQYKILYLNANLVQYRIHNDNFNIKMLRTPGYNWSLTLIFLKHCEYSVIAKNRLSSLISLLDQLPDIKENCDKYFSEMKLNEKTIETLNTSHHQLVLSWRYRIGNFITNIAAIFLPRLKFDEHNRQFIDTYSKNKQ